MLSEFGWAVEIAAALVHHDSLFETDTCVSKTCDKVTAL